MADFYRVTDGTTNIDVNVAASGFGAVEGGFGRTSFTPQQLDIAKSVEDKLFTENWRLKLQATSHVDAATQTQTLIRLLRQAWQHHRDPYKYPPVWIEQRTENEIQKRYALIWESFEINHESLFDYPFKLQDLITSFGVSITRFVWKSNAPGVATYTDMTNPFWVSVDSPYFLTNQSTSTAFSDIYNYDASLASFSSNYVSSNWTLFPFSPALNDAIYFGASRPFTNITFNIVVAGNYDWTLVAEYWNGSSWASLPYGEYIKSFPSGDLSELWKVAGPWSLGIRAPFNWAETTINGQARFWVRLRISAFNSRTTSPQNGSGNTMNFNKNFVMIENDAINGDVSPEMLMRLKFYSGGEGTPYFSTISRLIIAAKSDPGDFRMTLGMYNPATHAPGWVRDAYGTDAAGVGREPALEGVAVRVTFASDETMVMRIRLKTASSADDYVGRFKVLLTAEQEGGAVGDCSIRAVFRYQGTNDFDPSTTTKTVFLQAVSKDQEVIDLGEIELPPAEVAQGDNWGLAIASLYIDIEAQVKTGSAADLYLSHIDLVPIDEWSVDIIDPVVDTTNGSSALRGLTALDIDGGTVEERTVKLVVSGNNLYPVLNYGRGGEAVKIEPNKQIAFFFKFMHFESGGTWGTAPWFAITGASAQVELFHQEKWLSLRGNP